MKPFYFDFVKITLLIVNVVLVVSGTVEIGVGGVVKFDTELLNGYLTPLLKLLPAGGGTGADVWKLYDGSAVALIVFGAVSIVLGIVGCFAGACPSITNVTGYMVSLTMLIFVQITVAALLFSVHVGDNLRVLLLIDLVGNYAGDYASDDISSAWNYIFTEFSCCGVRSHTDFLLTYKWDRLEYIDGNMTLVQVPVTCCHHTGKYPHLGRPFDETCPQQPTTENSYYDNNCHDEIKDYLEYYEILMTSCSFCMAVIQAVALFLVVVLCIEVKRMRTPSTFEGKVR